MHYHRNDPRCSSQRDGEFTMVAHCRHLNHSCLTDPAILPLPSEKGKFPRQLSSYLNENVHPRMPFEEVAARLHHMRSYFFISLLFIISLRLLTVRGLVQKSITDSYFMAFVLSSSITELVSITIRESGYFFL